MRALSVLFVPTSGPVGQLFGSSVEYRGDRRQVWIRGKQHVTVRAAAYETCQLFAALPPSKQAAAGEEAAAGLSASGLFYLEHCPLSYMSLWISVHR